MNDPIGTEDGLVLFIGFLGATLGQALALELIGIWHAYVVLLTVVAAAACVGLLPVLVGAAKPDRSEASVLVRAKP